jgi:arylsulfatase A-like enzyme
MNNHINRRQFIKMVGIGSVLLPVSKYAQTKNPSKHPNVLLLFADQHRASAIACYGDPNVRTPNFDKLANTGVRMNAAMSNTPVCCPFRACLMSGLYSSHHGMMSNYTNFLPKGPLMAETFKKAGYQTGYIGKWHLEFPSHTKLFPNKYPGAHENFIPPERRFGYDWWRMGHNNHQHFEYSFFVQDAQNPTQPKKGWQPTAFTDLAIDFIKSQKQKDSPWFLTVSYGPPHTPYKAPETFTKNYDGDKLILSPNVPEGKAEIFARKNLPEYYGMIESLDVEVGRLMNLLDDLGISDNTIMLYTSDHGDMMGAFGCKVKRWPHDESARIPFLIRYPDVLPATKVVHDPIGAIDFFPTLAGLSNLQVPNGLDGVNYANYLTGKAKTPPRDYTFSQMHYGYVPWPGWRSLRTKEFHYAETMEGPWLLFDVREDPHQINNLVDKEEYANVVKKMQNHLKQIMEECGDTWLETKITADYGNQGDITNWQPGTNKLNQINLGADWPGRTGWPNKKIGIGL